MPDEPHFGYEKYDAEIEMRRKSQKEIEELIMKKEKNIGAISGPFNHENFIVRDWMTAFQQPVPVGLTTPETNIRVLRCKLILEEALEYIKASGCFVNSKFQVSEDLGSIVDLTAMFDATLDLKVVVNGAEVAMGITPEQSDEGFCEVMDSNWSKMWTEDEISQAINDGIIKPGWKIISMPAGCFPDRVKRLFSDGHDDAVPGVIVITPNTKMTRPFSQSKIWIVERPDGKAMKSPSYRPADLKPILHPAHIV